MKRILMFAAMVCCTIPAFAQSQVTIWLYRADSDNSGLPVTIHMDGRKLANLNKGQFFGVPVPVGLHTFSWTLTPGAKQVVVPIGSEQAYWEVSFRAAEPFLVMNSLSAERAMTAMGGLQPVDRAGVFDAGVIIPTQAMPKSTAAVASPTPQPSAQPTPVVAAAVQPTPVAAPVSITVPAQPVQTAQQSFTAPARLPRQEVNEHEALNAPRRFEIMWSPYSFSRQDVNVDGVDFGALNLHGGEVDFALKVNDSVSLVADASVHRSTVRDVVFTGSRVQTLTYRFGPRFSMRPNERVTTYFHALAGGVRFTLPDYGPDALNGFSVAAGGGVDVAVKKWFAIRVIQTEGSYYRAASGVLTSFGMRLGGGLVFRMN